VTAVFEGAPAEQAAGQRRAAARLAVILHEHRALPLIAWTVGTTGSALVGHVNAMGPAAQVRAAFDAWCAALEVCDRVETASSLGGAQRWATVVTGRVTVSITATMLPDDECRAER
jgi:hypothetical protein